MPVLEHEISPELQRELQKHPGKWVAMTEREIIAVGDSAGEVRETAARQGITEPTLYRVPEGRHTYFF